MLEYLDRADAPRLAVARRAGDGPALLFLPGYASDMEGAKAAALDGWAAAHGRACTRFDYRGCGASAGMFDTATLSDWLADATAALDATLATAPGPAILIGSSMGGWLALLLASARRAEIAALVLVAAAPDFTRWGVVEKMTSEERAQLARAGRFERAGAPGERPASYSRALIDDAGRHLLLDHAIGYTGPVRLLHGQADADVPWRIALTIAERLAGDDVCVTLVKDGDHRLSRPADIALMLATVAAL